MKTKGQELLEAIRANPKDAIALQCAINLAREALRVHDYTQDLDTLATRLLDETGLSLDDLRSKSRSNHHAIEARKQFCRIAHALHIPIPTIAKFINRKRTSVYKTVSPLS